MTLSLTNYKKIRDNKDLIIRNYYYREHIGFKKNQYENFVKKSNDKLITSINSKTKEMKSININKVFKQIVCIFSEENYKIIDILICYSLNLDKLTDIKRDNLINTYEELWIKINKFKYFTSEYNNLLIEMAETDDYTCNSYNIIDIPLKTFLKQIKDKDMISGEHQDGDLYYIIYDEIIYYFKEYKKSKIELCINRNINSKSEYDKIEYLIEGNSPIRDSMENSKNLPEETLVHEPLSRRKSISELNELKIDREPGVLGSYLNKDILKKINIKYKISEIMKCFRNDKDLDDNIIYKQANSNYHREPFIKDVINFPPIYKSKNINKCDLNLIYNIRLQMNNVLSLIKNKYPPAKNKKYFLIDLAGGSGKHFDYSLYAFTKMELKEYQDTFLTKKNLWKKLEFKSNLEVKNIKGLANYMEKSASKLFDTVNNTFSNKFKDMYKNMHSKIGKKWMKNNINNNDYFAEAIENILKGQKDKIYIIWNVEDQNIYMDEFLNSELKIKRVDNIPQIYVDQENLNDGNIKIIVETNKKGSYHEINYKDSFKFKFIRN